MRRRGERGSMYAEVMAAIALVGVATMIAGSMLNVHPLVSTRLRAQDEAIQVIEATLENLRAGTIPLASTTLRDLPINVRPDMKVVITVKPQATQDLFSIRIDARCSALGRPVERHVQTMLWRPS